MSHNGKLNVALSTLIGWRDLPEPERTQIEERLAALADSPPHEWPKEEVEPVVTVPGEYMLRGPGDFRVYFTHGEKGITVTGIILQETIDRYFARQS